MIVHRRDPQGPGGRHLRELVLPLLSRHLDDDVQRAGWAAAVGEPDNEVRVIGSFLAVDGVGNHEAQVVVLHVGDDVVHVLQDLSRLLFPGVRVGDDVRHLALVGPRRVGGPQNGLECRRALGARHD